MAASFNNSQIQAIEHKSGPCLVLAGPGSGKTATIIQRTLNLIEKEGVKPSNILVITFTKAAANEMKQRFTHRMGSGQGTVTFGTFHAVYFMVLKYAYHFTAQNIITEEQRYQLMRDICSHYHLEYEDEAEFISGIYAEISTIKNQRIPIQNFYSSQCGEKVFRDIYKAYQDTMTKNALIDFDDMLLYTYELFVQRPDILKLWQDKYQYILVDEFQDINQIQYDILRMLALPQNNLFIVGDDDQSIYRFRGSKPEIMLNFKKDYPDAREILLDTNYRCNPEIVKKSLKLINHNQIRFQKEMKANKKVGEPVELLIFDTQKKEAMFLIDEIKKSVEKGGKYSDYAVLFRTNTGPQYLMEQMLAYNVPFKTRDKIPNLYDHWLCKDIFTYIRIAKGSRKRSDFLQIMNRPKRFLSRDSLTEQEVAFDVWLSIYEEKPWIAERIERMEYDFKMLAQMSPYAAINYIRKGIGYDDFIKEYADYRHMKEEELYDTLDEIQEASRGFKTYDAWFEHIENYTKELEILAQKKNQNPNAVSLVTLHSSKGLEFNKVFIIEVNEGVIPYKKAVLEQDLEEERRMFYVGMTRAKEKLWISSVKEIHNKSSEISRFIKELD